MKKLNIFIAALFVLFSCENEIDIEPIVKPVDDDFTEVAFNLQVPGHTKPIVYGISKEDENKVDELDVLVFSKRQDSLPDTLAYRITVDAGDISDLATDDYGNKKKIKLKLKRNSSEVKLVFIANAKSVVDSAIVKAIENEEKEMDDVLEKLVYNFGGKWPTLPMKPFPMWGQTSTYIKVLSSVEANVEDIVLLRSVAKVDVGVDVYGDPAIGFGSRFILKHIYVYNAKNKGSIVPNLSNLALADNKVTAPSIPSGTEVVQSPQKYVVTENPFFNEIYLPESDTTSANRTFLIVGGSYDGGSESFYRIDFLNSSGKKLYLLRNYRFLVNITNVSRSGLPTKEDAINEKTSHIDYTLGVTNESIKSIVYNGQYMLGVSDSDVSLDWEESANNTIAVATDYPAGWSASTEDSWITLTSSSGGVNNSIVYNIARNDDESGLTRTGKIIVKAGSLTQKITVSQNLGSNSLFVLPGRTAKIPALFANADGNIRVTDGTTYSAEVLWQDAVGVISSVSLSGTGKNSIINVTSGSNQGNAVIALKRGNEILWSWHTWVTDYNPSVLSNQKQYNGVTFMDRNLGALVNYKDNKGLGLIYQWGRKDPFPGASSTTQNTKKEIYNASGAVTTIAVARVSAPNNFDNSVNNPMTFYTSDEFPWYNWYGLIEANNSLWITPSGSKTAYDPCPHGWRVPVNPDVWIGATKGTWNNGCPLMPDFGFYPATGGWDFTNGTITEVGTHGYYWTANPSGTKAKVMRIAVSSDISFNSTPFRASGNPVRCVKE